MKNLKILLCDPRHSTIGSHVTSIPIGIGYMASYIKEKIKNVKLDIVLEIDSNKILSDIKNFKPDIVACSNYVWNSQISNFICSEAKKNMPPTSRKKYCVLIAIYFYFYSERTRVLFLFLTGPTKSRYYNY